MPPPNSTSCTGTSCVSVSRYPPQKSIDSGGTASPAAAQAKSTARAAKAPSGADKKQAESFDFVISPNVGGRDGAALQVALLFEVKPKERAANELARSLRRALDALEKGVRGGEPIDVSIPVPTALLLPLKQYTEPKRRK